MTGVRLFNQLSNVKQKVAELKTVHYNTRDKYYCSTRIGIRGSASGCESESDPNWVKGCGKEG